MTSKKRPTAVTIIGRFILIGGIAGGILTLVWGVGILVSPELRQIMAARFYPETLPWAAVGTAVFVAGGRSILRGRNWGRIVYLVYAPVTILAGVLLYGSTFRQVVAVMLYVVFLVFLTRPAANEFFRGSA